MIDTNIIFYFFIAFGIKHFIVDFLWQLPYEWQNKGKYGHPGGIWHSAKHAITTFFILAIMSAQFGLVESISINLILWVSFVEFLVHYHMDWIKVNINKKMDWGPTTTPEFWYMVGLDQFVHFLNYVWIIWMII